jgi:molybdenum cofactor biosynthesis enzyme MoaA
LTLDKPYHVRFIELMPTDSSAYGNYESLFIPVEEFMKKIHQIDRVQVEPLTDSYGPARLCRLPDAVGKIGFIAPISWHFCGSCNRLRLTADGHRHIQTVGGRKTIRPPPECQGPSKRLSKSHARHRRLIAPIME